MSLERGGDRLWDGIETDEALVEGTLKLAERDIKVSEDIRKVGDYDWSFAISYNAMLQAGRALMFSRGFRPRGEHKHLAVVEFVKANFSEHFTDRLLFIFDKSRKKRHSVVYEETDLVSEGEAKSALAASKEFVEKVRALVGGKK